MKRRSNIKKGSGIVEDEPVSLNTKRESVRSKIASPDRATSQRRSDSRPLTAHAPFSKRNYVPHNCSRNVEELSNNRKSDRHCHHHNNTNHSPAPRISTTRPTASSFNSDLKSPLYSQNKSKQKP